MSALTAEPLLWNALAVDRLLYPWEGPAPEAAPDFTDCTKCRGCDRMLRPWHTKVKDYPGTQSDHGNGRCKSCHRHGRGL